MWTERSSSLLSDLWKGDSLGAVRRTDRTDTEWLNINTGASLVLVTDGGWEEASDEVNPSRFRVFTRVPNGPVHEMTTEVLGRTTRSGKFDPTKTGSDTYQGIHRECRAAVYAFLNLGEDPRAVHDKI